MRGQGIALSDFAGRWTVFRRIDDHLTNGQSRFEGAAIFTPSGPDLDYHETGTLFLPDGASLAAERRYRWTAEDGRIAVFFGDGRPFHRFGTRTAEAAHWCDPDTYRVSYVFTRWPDWTATWDVTGPRKDYRMVSHYSR
jgi:hypothetical protein